jgi:hypothetical protein
LNFQKNIDHNEADHPEGAIAPKLVFSDDAMVVDYLNALLASSSASSTDSAEIHFVHLANGADWKPAVPENGYVGSAISYETEFSKREAEELRRENEHLKFKTELAEIDSQVLRGENDNLKSEMAAQAKQLNELKEYLGEVLNQNIDFQSKIEQLREELDLSKIIKMPSPPELIVSMPNDDKLPEKEIEPDITEMSDKALSEPVDTPQPTKIDKTLSGVDEDTAIISNQQIAIERSFKNPPPDTIIFSRQQTPVLTPSMNTRTDSRILKQDELKELESRQETSKPEKSFSLDSVPQEKFIEEKAEAPLNQDVDQLLDSEEPEADQEDSSTLNTVSPDRDRSDEITMDTAPDPKIVVQRNVKLYQDIQKVTDGTNPVTAGHGIVL